MVAEASASVFENMSDKWNQEKELQKLAVWNKKRPKQPDQKAKRLILRERVRKRMSTFSTAYLAKYYHEVKKRQPLLEERIQKLWPCFDVLNDMPRPPHGCSLEDTEDLDPYQTPLVREYLAGYEEMCAIEKILGSVPNSEEN